MRCILHIGTEKTGSTAIQQYLYAHRLELQQAAGVAISSVLGEGNNRALPAAFMSDQKTDDYLHLNGIAAPGARSKWKQELLDSFASEVSEASTAASVFLISSEHFHSRLSTCDELSDLHSYLSTLFDSIEVICYLRRQDQLAISRYSESLRAGHTPAFPLPLGVFKQVDVIPPYYNFEALLCRWANAFGEKSIKPRIYSNKKLSGSDVVSDFLHAVGIDVSRVPKPGKSRQNVALSREAQVILLKVNEKLCDTEGDAARKIRSSLIEYLFRHATGESNLPTASQAREFCKAFDMTNSALSRRWFGRSDLFEADFGEYPSQKQEVDMDKVVELLAGYVCDHIE